MRWGILSDTYGRKPILVWGVLGAGFAMLIFGTAQHYWQAVLGRIVSGLLSGNSGVNKSFVAEVTDASNRSAGFSYISAAWFTGCVIGPLLGGLLCQPAEKYPTVFAQDGVFAQYPYLLPALASCALNVVTAIFTTLMMVETRVPQKPSEQQENQQGPVGEVELPTLAARLGLRPSSGTGADKPPHTQYNPLSSRDTDTDTDTDVCADTSLGLELESDDLDLELNPLATDVSGELGGAALTKGLRARSNSFGVDTGRRSEVSAPTAATQPPEGPPASVCLVEVEPFDTCACLWLSLGLYDSASVPQQRPADEISGGDQGEEVSVTRRKLVVLVCCCYGLCAMAFLIFDQTFPLFAEEAVRRDGMGFSSSECGLAISASGLFGLIFTVTTVPWIMRTYATHRVLRWSCYAMIPAVLSTPLVGRLYHYDLYGSFGVGGSASAQDLSGPSYVLLWALVLFGLLVKNCLGTLLFQAVFLQISRSVPSHELGLANGMGQSFASLSRTLGPTLGGALWGTSLRLHVLMLNFLLGVGILIVCVNLNGQLVCLDSDIYTSRSTKKKQSELDLEQMDH